MKLERLWYGRRPFLPLVPLSWLYCLIALLRRWAYGRGFLASEHPGVPVVVVGNLTVGGAGKTPLVLWLVSHLAELGFKPGIASRGYGGRVGDGPAAVHADSQAEDVGDEPLLLKRRSGVPVVVGRRRAAAARELVARHGCDILVTDDGLQHYALARDLEILVIDGRRGLGNRHCLPAGPLREPPGRARSVDLCIRNGGEAGQGRRMRLIPGQAHRLVGDERCALVDFAGRPLLAIAGIGHPERFFAMLRELGLVIESRAYPDHHRFSAEDVAAWGQGPVIMTEKDAVKCTAFAASNHWFVPVDAEPEPEFVAALDHGLATVLNRRVVVAAALENPNG